jgi:hypothetical protein
MAGGFRIRIMAIEPKKPELVPREEAGCMKAGKLPYES